MNLRTKTSFLIFLLFVLILVATGNVFVPAAKLTENESFSIVTDYLGTPTNAYKSDGTQVWERQLNSYGGKRAETGGANFVPFRFQGQYFDGETGFCYNRFRYYDPENGNYISQDPIRLAGNNPTLYGYVKDPNSWVDVFGLSACHDNGKAGEDAARTQLQNEDYDIVGEQVSMTVNGKNIRADFVATKYGQTYVFEAKNGNGGLTTNQGNSGVYNMSNLSNPNGGSIDTSKGTNGSFTVNTNNRADVGKKGDTVSNASFNVLKYNEPY